MQMTQDATCAGMELQSNLLLKAIREGGILYEYVDKGPLEVLCAPQQSFLELSDLAPYLMLPLPPQPSALLSDNNEEAILIIEGKPTILQPKQHVQVSKILREQFLDYHLMHFDSVASPVFVTARGHRGEFTENLGSVSRYGRIGTAAILCDFASSVRENDDTTLAYHPNRLHVFVVEKPLMDEQEMHNLLSSLRLAIYSREMISTQIELASVTHAIPEKGSSSISLTREMLMNYRRKVVEMDEVKFADFQGLMGLSVCRPLARMLSDFVENCQKSSTSLLDNTSVSCIITLCMDQCKHIPALARNPKKMRLAAEGFEQYIMTKLYWRAFMVDTEEQHRDKLLYDKLSQFSAVITAEQLDAIEAVEHHPLWDSAKFELEGMNFFKSPREKLGCAVRACKQLTESITDVLALRKQDKDGSAPDTLSRKNVSGADELLPCFMLLVLRAIPRNYYSNVSYVKRFRTTTLMSSEESYCLANLESAAEFWSSFSPLPSQNNSTLPRCPSFTDELFSTRVGPTCSELPDGKATSNSSLLESITIASLQPLTPLCSNQQISLETQGDSPVGKKEGRINVEKLLLDDHKIFDDLTVEELRAIVDEARCLLSQKRGANIFEKNTSIVGAESLFLKHFTPSQLMETQHVETLEARATAAESAITELQHKLRVMPPNSEVERNVESKLRQLLHLMQEDQQECETIRAQRDELRAENERLRSQTAKHEYRIKHLLQTIKEIESK